MDRREFLKSTAAATAAITGAAAETLPAPATSKGISELRLAVAYEDGFAGPADWAHRLARSIGELSNGRLHVVPTFGIANASGRLAAGDADLCFDAVDTLLDAHRGFAYFAGLPGGHGMDPQHLQSWISVGGGQALWDDLAGEVGIKPLLAAHTGSQSLLLATERTDSMSALAGRKTHVRGLARDVARGLGLGLDTAAVSTGQLATAMQRGEVQIAECGGAIASFAAGLPTVARYSAGTSINRNGTAMYLGIRRGLWDSFGATEQALLTSAAAREYHLSLAEEEAHRHLLYPAPAPAYVWPIAAELAHAIQRVAAAVIAHAASADAKSRRIAASYAAFGHPAAGEEDATA